MSCSALICRPGVLVPRQLVSLLGSTHIDQLQPCQHPARPMPPCLQWRQYSADAPEPMIVPLQKQQQQQQPATTSRQVTELAVDLPPANIGPWERANDKVSGQPYWWNPKTGTTTPVGASKPDAWVAVVDKQTQAEYFWNKESGETTAVGEPLPGPEGRIVAAAGPGWQQQQVRQAGAGSVLMNSLAVGFGVGLVFAVIRLVF